MIEDSSTDTLMVLFLWQILLWQKLIVKKKAS